MRALVCREMQERKKLYRSELKAMDNLELRSMLDAHESAKRGGDVVSRGGFAAVPRGVGMMASGVV